MSIIDHLEPERVLLDVEARSRKRALETLSDGLAAALDGVSSTHIFNALFKRERLGCTSLGQGVALPHATLAELSAPVAVFVRLAEAVDFETDDDIPVDLIFGILLPETDPAGCSDQLSHIASLLNDEALRRRLRDVTSPAEAWQALSHAQLPPAGLEANA